MRLSSVCSLQTARRAALMPACWSSRPVRRVSSQQTSATRAEDLDRARREVAEVADRCGDEVRAWARPRSHVVVPDLDDVADLESPSFERAGFGLDHRPRLPHRDPDASRGASAPSSGPPLVVEVGDVEREAHADRVDPATRAQHERALESVASEQAIAPRGAIGRHVRRREDPGVAHQPRHARSVPRPAASRRAAALRRPGQPASQTPISGASTYHLVLGERTRLDVETERCGVRPRSRSSCSPCRSQSIRFAVGVRVGRPIPTRPSRYSSAPAATSAGGSTSAIRPVVGNRIVDDGDADLAAVERLAAAPQLGGEGRRRSRTH